MSIKRYDFYDDGRHCRNLTDRVESRTGDFVSFADHLDSLAQVTRERDEFAAICAAVIKNLGIENDNNSAHLPNHAADVSADRVAAWNAWRKEASERDEIVNKLYAAERERDEAVEALRFYANADNYTMGTTRDGYFDVCTSIEDDKGEIARAVLAKIEEERE